MSDEIKKDPEGQTAEKSPSSSGDPSRRDVLKGLASVPVLGVFFAGWYQKTTGGQGEAGSHHGRAGHQ